MSENLENLAISFFKKFARSEFALKDCGFHTGINKVAKADWEAFALTIENTLSEQELNKPEAAELKEAVRFLLDAPPKTNSLIMMETYIGKRVSQTINQEQI